MNDHALYTVFDTSCSYRVPPNVVFEVDDVEAEWPDREPYDFFHSQYMCGSIEDWQKLFEQAYRSIYHLQAEKRDSY